MRPNFRSTGLAIAIATALSHPVAWAVPASAFEAFTGASANGINGTTYAYSYGSYASSYTSAQQGTAHASTAEAYVTDAGSYVVWSRAEGSSTGTARVGLSYTLTNTSGLAQNYTLSFHINSGFLFTDAQVPLAAGEYLSAYYGASITAGTHVLFNSSATLYTDDAGTSLTLDGTRLLDGGDDGSDGRYDWASGDYAIDLGVLNPGESVDLMAEVLNLSDTAVGTYDYSGGGSIDTTSNGPCGYDMVDVDGDGSFYPVPRTPCALPKGSAGSRYDDPISFSSEPLTITTGPATTQSVPEPGGLGLIGLGLAALHWTRRRRATT